MTDETTGPKQGHRWQPGQSGNPGGRPAGARHAALVALDQIGIEAAADVLNAVVAAAKGGDMRAADILCRRIWPERRGRPVAFDLPKLREPADLANGLAAVAEAVAAGELSPEEAQAVAAALEGWRRAVETVDIEQRLAALERAASESAR
jgi:hypothetical protein